MHLFGQILKTAFQKILEASHMVKGATRVRRHEIIGYEVPFLYYPAGFLEEFLEPHDGFDGGLVHEGKDFVIAVLRRKLDLS